MLRLKFFVFAVFCLSAWSAGFASEQLKPAIQEQAEFDNPVNPTEQATPATLKSSKKATKKQSSKELEATYKSEPVSDTKEGAPEHSQTSQTAESTEPSQHSTEAAQKLEGQNESAPQTSDSATATVGTSAELIDSLDTPEPVEKNYGWIWFSIVALAVLLVMFLIA